MADGVFVSAVSKVEVLGFHKLDNSMRDYFEVIFRTVLQLPIDSEVVDYATRLRQSLKMTLGDALIAGTAMVHNLELITRNLADFKNIHGLQTNDPFSPTPRKKGLR